jgi:pseudaminic acid cytidylyltransferase
MVESIKCVCVIPARGGSKRIPRKNIRDFLGKPLISYSIETALESKLFDRVYVSTEDREIANISQEFGADIIERPEDLADDFATTLDVINHAKEYLEAEDYKYFCTIYPTAPLLQIKYLKEGFERLKDSNAVYSFSATSMPFPIWRTFKIDRNGRCEMFFPQYFNSRSQDLEEAYQDAGQFYWERLDRDSMRFYLEKILFQL